MNLKILGRHLGNKRLWNKAMKDFTREEIESVVEFIAKQALERHLAMGDFGCLKSGEEVKAYFKRWTPELQNNIFRDELMRAYAAKLQELKSVKEAEANKQISMLHAVQKPGGVD